MLKTTYLELLSKITTLNGVKHVDMYAGQYLNEADGEELPFPTPAVFIEFTSIPTGELGRRVQEGEALIRFHLVSDVVMNEVSNSTPEPIRSNALDHLGMIDDFHKLMEKSSGTHFNSMTRVGVTADTAPTDIYVHIAEYNTRFTDESAVRKYIPATPSLNIDPQLNA